MPQPFNLPRFNAVSLRAQYEILDRRDKARPMLALFNREQFEGAEVKIRRFRDKPQRVPHTSYGGRAMPVPRETMEELSYRPSVIKLKDTLDQDDVNLFVDYESQAALNDVSQRQTNRLVRMDRALGRIARRFQTHSSEERHVMCCGAFLGGYTYKLGDKEITVDLNLTELTAPTTAWDNIAAKIVTDIGNQYSEFVENNGRGLAPTHVFYNPKNFRTYWLKNTQWLATMAMNPALALWFTGQRNPTTAAVDFIDLEGRITDPLFGLTWVPIEGTYREYNGTATDRWPVNKLAYARLGADGCLPQWLMAYDALQNPEPTYRIEVGYPDEGDDVKVVQTVYFDNGIPAFEFPEMVCVVTVVP